MQNFIILLVSISNWNQKPSDQARFLLYFSQFHPGCFNEIFVYISKWNVLRSTNKFKNYWVLGVAMQIAKYSTHIQPFTCVNKNSKIFSVPNSADSEQDFDSIHRRHPDYESIVASIHNKALENCTKDRIDMILVSIAPLK